MRINLFNDLFLLQRIDHLIRTRATGSPKALASKLEISECSVYRLLDDLKIQGLPIAYDRQAHTYYYTDQVVWRVEFLVGTEKLISLKGGKKSKNFLGLAEFESGGSDLCFAFLNHGAQ
jgi:hypothetical protein